MDKVMRFSSNKEVGVFSESSCCLSYTVSVLLQEFGINPPVYEIDQDPDCREIERGLVKLGCTAPVPIVFIGGKLMGSTN
ncbi:hypothetical protein SAY87_013238 [Trapa incisa]|uniref:Glutaredoxin domain-containing protein n=1 Tax=Trapa incisa TaxID=236973 RepID=A0AAN7KAQ9_9MYRT|nr:hypothetical protein SAY87_013238 [Trapa incisa]